MNTLITWNQLREMEEAQNRVNRFLGGFPNRLGSGETHSLAVADWSPEIDISQDDHECLVKADLPEMKKDDVRVTVEDGILYVSGNTKAKRKIRKGNSIVPSAPTVASDAALRCPKIPIARK